MSDFDFDTSVRAQDDFFGYVNGKWLAAHPIPASETRWGKFEILRDEAWKNMRQLYEELTDSKAKPKAGTIEQQARDLYYTGMHFGKFEAAHLKRVNEYLEKIDGVSNLRELSSLLGELEAIGVAGLWRVDVDADHDDATKHILHLMQVNLTLPERDYYVEDSAKMKEIRSQYGKHARKVHGYFPELAGQAKAFWQTVWQVELDLATQSRSNAELRDVEKNFNRRSFKTLAKDYDAIDWQTYAAALGWKTGADVSVGQPEYFAWLNKQLRTRPLDDWKTYLKWRFITSYYSKINDRFAELRFEFFGKVLTGAEKILPLWKRTVLTIDGAMGEGVGRLYAERHFPESSKKQVLDMVEDVRTAYRQRIERLDWMSVGTKKLALKKLDNIKVLIGYPDKWRDFSGLKTGRDSHIDNLMAAERFDTAYWLSKLPEPTSRDDWLMNPQTVNAYHDHNRLVICFPAAILQPPFFDPKAHIAENMGGMGTVIGHELTHGFDDQGCQFDYLGNVKPWQTPKERAAFAKRAKVIIDQADHFEVLPGLCLKGQLVIGESIADLGGIEIAFTALQNELGGKMNNIITDDLTAAQLFFASYATLECSKTREARLREFTASDPHPAETFRVNGMLTHVDAFYEAFGVKPKDKLYRPPKSRAKIW